MPPEERRAAIIAAALPLLREYGPAVSTRQIAEAAGVAEGTIFGVFPDKRSLIHAAMLSAFAPEPVEHAMRKIDQHTDLRTRLTAATNILARRMAENSPLLSAMRRAAHGDGPHGSPAQTASTFFEQFNEVRRRLIAAVATVIEPDRAALRHPPTVVAELLLSILAVQGRGGFAEIDGVDNDDVVTLLLDGLLIRPGQTITGDRTPC